jgi:hypothetical protein
LGWRQVQIVNALGIERDLNSHRIS